MKLVVCALSLLAGLPSLMSAQKISFAVPRLQGPTVRATLGPIAVVATLSGHRVSVRPASAPRRTATPRARTGSSRDRQRGAGARHCQPLCGDPLPLRRREPGCRVRLLGVCPVRLWAEWRSPPPHLQTPGLGGAPCAPRHRVSGARGPAPVCQPRHPDQPRSHLRGWQSYPPLDGGRRWGGLRRPVHPSGEVVPGPARRLPTCPLRGSPSTLLLPSAVSP